MALPPGGAGRSDQPAGSQVGERASVHDALHHGLLLAPARRRPSQGSARGSGQLRVPGRARREPPAGRHLHRRILGADGDGGGLHPAGHRAGRAGAVGLAVRHSCATQLGDRAAGWREAKAASHARELRVEHRNRRAVAGLRLTRRTRRQRAHGRDTQEPSAGDSHGPLETSGETEWTGNFYVYKIGLVRLLAEGRERVYARAPLLLYLQRTAHLGEFESSWSPPQRQSSVSLLTKYRP